MNKPTKFDFAYIAGFFDGEGCVSIYQQKNRTGISYARLKLVIGNTNLTVLSWIHSIVGGNLNQHGGKIRSLNHAPAWTLCISNVEGMELMLRQMLPYLKVKKPQAELALAFIALTNKNPFIRRVPNKISRFETEMHELNKRGPKGNVS